jgi:peptide/nickel transport system permease protein
MMLRYIVKRSLRTIPQLFLLSIVAFIIIQLPPGDIVQFHFDRLRNAGVPFSEGTVQAFRRAYGLDRPLFVQYLIWMRNILFRFDFGYSFFWMQPVDKVIVDRIPLTFALALGSLLFTWAVGIPIGVFVAVKQYSVADYVLTSLSFVAMAVPPFLLATVLMYWASVKLGVNIVGMFSQEFQGQSWSWAKFVDMLKHLWLPMVLVGVGGVPGMVRMLRATMLDELHKQYVTVARAKGLAEITVLLRYPMRLAISPIVSGFTWLLPWLFSGGFLVEMILSVPTASQAMVTACFAQDMYLASSYVLITGALTSVSSMLSDFLLAALDPRIRLGSEEVT